MTEWRTDNLEFIGGHAATLLGDPRLVDTDRGKAIEFDGVDDGILLDVNPLQGLARFAIEIVFQPAADGPEEQRFLHVEETSTGNRALIELRMNRESRWTLNTFMRTGETGLTLLDRSVTYSAGQWHTATLTYDGETMTHAVDGVVEQSGTIRFAPLGAGRTSIGVRQNQVSWFKGRIHLIRFRS